MNNFKLLDLSKLGQAVWLDNISRELINSGELKNLVKNYNLRGVTSNPSIFLQAIAKSHDYDEAIVKLSNKSPEEIYEILAIKDIQDGADILRPVFEQTKGLDGFISLEVSPHLANNSEGTIAEAQRLWQEVDRPNLMIKIPGTSNGFTAIKSLIALGININVTLLFSTKAYLNAAKAYIDGLQERAELGLAIDSVHSVASFFISRIDSQIDAKLEKLDQVKAHELKGHIAIANAKVAYALFNEIYKNKPALELLKQGASPQRLLWASTSSKNPAYKDVVYVEELIGKNTVNTMPPATLAAFLDHGLVSQQIDNNLAKAELELLQLKTLGIDLEACCTELLSQGLELFCQSYDDLLLGIANKLKALPLGHQ